MANYSQNFDGVTTGQFPTDWTISSGGSVTTVNLGNSNTSPNACKITTGLTYVTANNVADGNILAACYAANQPQIIFRLQDTSNYYYAVAGATSVTFHKVVSGVDTTIGSVTTPNIGTAGNYAWVQVQYVGNQFSARTWPIAGSAGSYVTLGTTDTTFSNGKFGFSKGATTSFLDTVTVTDNGSTYSAGTLTLGTLTPTSAPLSWTAPNNPAGTITYNVQRTSTTDTGFASATTLVSGQSGTTYTDNTVASGTAYLYRVQQVDTTNGTVVTNTVTATIPTISFTATPSNVVASSTGNVISLVGSNTAWTSGTTFSVTGATKTAQNFTDATHATITITAGSTVASNNITISDSTDSATATLSTTSAPVVATGYSATLSGSGGSVGTPVTITYALTPTGGTSSGVTITPAQTGVSGSFSAASVTLNTGTPSVSVTFTPSSSGTASISSTNSGGFTDPAAQNYTVSSSPLALTSVAATPTTGNIALAATASGGTGPYTHRLYRSTTFVFTPTGSTAGSGNCIAVQTGASLAYNDASANASTVYYYTDVVTDSAGTSATVTAATIFAVKPSFNIAIGIIGDSISHQTAGNNFTAGVNTAPDWMAQVLRNSLGGVSTVSVVNQSVSGSKSADWQPGGSFYNAAIAAFGSPTQTPYVQIMLGHNEDSTTPSAYQSSMNTIVAALVAAGYKVMLHAPIFTTPASVLDDNMAQFGTVSIANLVANYTTSNPGYVLQGDPGVAFAYFAAYPAELADGTHPTQLGYQHLGTMWANAWRQYFARDASLAGYFGRGRIAQ